MKNHEKSYTKCGKETIPRPFSEKPKVNISLDQISKVFYIFLNCLPSCGLSKVIETKQRDHLLLPHINFF